MNVEGVRRGVRSWGDRGTGQILIDDEGMRYFETTQSRKVPFARL